MRLTITNPAAVIRLLDFLLEWNDCIARRVSDDEIDVQILGSRRQVMNELELRARVDEWRTREPDVCVELTRASL